MYLLSSFVFYVAFLFASLAHVSPLLVKVVKSQDYSGEAKLSSGKVGSKLEGKNGFAHIDIKQGFIELENAVIAVRRGNRTYPYLYYDLRDQRENWAYPFKQPVKFFPGDFVQLIVPKVIHMHQLLDNFLRKGDFGKDSGYSVDEIAFTACLTILPL